VEDATPTAIPLEKFPNAKAPGAIFTTPEIGRATEKITAVPSVPAEALLMNCTQQTTAAPFATDMPYTLPADAFTFTDDVTVALTDADNAPPEAVVGRLTAFTAITSVPVGAVPSAEIAAVSWFVLSAILVKNGFVLLFAAAVALIGTGAEALTIVVPIASEALTPCTTTAPGDVPKFAGAPKAVPLISARLNAQLAAVQLIGCCAAALATKQHTASTTLRIIFCPF
jgi:hypothetical protein